LEDSFEYLENIQIAGVILCLEHDSYNPYSEKLIQGNGTGLYNVGPLLCLFVSFGAEISLFSQDLTI
jgi:hypothetical protein